MTTSMAATRSFYLSQDAEEIIAARSGGGEGRRGDRSGVVDAMIRRYSEIMRRELPRLSPAEWKQLTSAINTQTPITAWEITMLEAVVRDSNARRGVKPSHTALVTMISKMSYAQKVALVDEVERRLLKAAK